MPLICNKQSKKLFPALATLGTIACHTNLSSYNVKVFGFSDIPLYIAGQRVVKLNNLTTAETYQVVMLGGWLDLIMVVSFIKMDFLYQAQFLEHP